MVRNFTRHEDGISNIIYADYLNELQIALEDDDVRIDSKAPTVHTHTQSQVDGLQSRLTNIESTLTAKADSDHKHTASDLTSGIIGSSFLPIGTTEGTVAAGDHNHDAVYPHKDLLIPLNAHVISKSNPHNVTKSQVGLSNVDNTSDMDKPVSTATQLALNSGLASKANADHHHTIANITNLQSILDGKASTSHNHSGVYAPVSHNHDASQITSGVLNAARVPNQDASKTTSGTFNIARIPTGTSASTVALGNHAHAQSQVLTKDRKVTTATLPRTNPGTEHWALAQLPVGHLMTRLGTNPSISSGGVNWVQFWSPSAGICWVNWDHTGAP